MGLGVRGAGGLAGTSRTEAFFSRGRAASTWGARAGRRCARLGRGCDCYKYNYFNLQLQLLLL